MFRVSNHWPGESVRAVDISNSDHDDSDLFNDYEEARPYKVREESPLALQKIKMKYETPTNAASNIKRFFAGGSSLKSLAHMQSTTLPMTADTCSIEGQSSTRRSGHRRKLLRVSVSPLVLKLPEDDDGMARVSVVATKAKKRVPSVQPRLSQQEIMLRR